MEKALRINNSKHSVLSEITSLFFEIENKIISLNQCSSDDFQELNNLIKANLSISKIVSSNIELIFELSGKDGNREYLEQIYEHISTLKLHLDELEEVFDVSVKSFDGLIKHLNMISAPLNNFNQNLSSLKLLLANLKLISTCCSRNPDGFNVEESDLIEKTIGKVKNVCPIIDENIYVLKGHLEKTKEDILSLKNKKLPDLRKNAEITQVDIKEIISLTDKALKEKPPIEKLIKSLRNDLNNTLPVLLKQDDICRDVEIFHKTHDAILKELVMVKADNENSAINNFSNKLNKLQIPRISDNQISRILSINEQYQCSVEKITNEMINSKNGIKEIFTRSEKFLLNNKNIDNTCADKHFESFNRKLSEFMEGYFKYTDEIVIINRVVNELYEKFSDVEMIENAIEQRIIDKIYVGELLIRSEEEIAGQAQNIFKIYCDNHIHKSKLIRIFGDAIEAINESIRANAAFSFKNGNVNCFESKLKDFKKEFEKFDSNRQLINKKYIEAAEQEQQFTENVNNAVNQTKYYGFFDNTVKQVVLLLENINEKIKSDVVKQVNNEPNYQKLNEREFAIK